MATLTIDDETYDSLSRLAAKQEMTVEEWLNKTYTGRPSDEPLPPLPPGESAYDAFLAAGAIGCVKGGPSDVATNPKYMEGFGKS
ncbi:hypothetical protein [Alienimonas chondri]|uniref:Antitoxin n=1 Tax=Alienimonas chondri TaxID=2681879 RepID=A0ABX1VAQ9_9PLAN|nr:hypothetical protein [Alienimonas chondri]NNJ25179.1 hypothetical protein [Alienimonas chondri]